MVMLPVRLSSVRVSDASGAHHTLGAIASKDCVVLVFLRHFACPSCSRTAHAVLERASEIARLGASIIVIGSGSSDALAAFSERVGVDVSVTAVTDPTREAHREAGMLRSKWATFGPRAVVRSLALYAEGHYAKRRTDDGDLDQQGGVLLFADGRLVFEHRNHFVGDDVEVGDIVSALLQHRANESAIRT